MDTRERIMKYFEEKKLTDGLTYDTELLDSRYVNSMFALEIVLFVEKEFGIKLKRKEISKENFRTINAIAETVERHGRG